MRFTQFQSVEQIFIEYLVAPRIVFEFGSRTEVRASFPIEILDGYRWELPADRQGWFPTVRRSLRNDRICDDASAIVGSGKIIRRIYIYTVFRPCEFADAP